MSESRRIEIEADVFERIQPFVKVFAEVGGMDPADVSIELTANSIMLLGLDLMLAQFFEQLDEGTLRRSLEIFYEKHPTCKPVERLHRTSNKLADLHITLSRRYPRVFFEFMFETLKGTDWDKARERWDELFRPRDRNGDS